MVTEEDIRRVALSLPGSVEKPYSRLPSFRVRGALFLRIHELPDAFFIRCAGLEDRDELLKAGPGTFSSRSVTTAPPRSWSGSAGSTWMR